MSVIYCDGCDRFVDLDFEDTHVLVGESEVACQTSDDSEPQADFSGAGGLDDERYGR